MPRRRLTAVETARPGRPAPVCSAAVRAQLDILYRDDALCAVMKPAGLAVHRGWAVADHYALDLLGDRLGQWVYPVHRLDQPTSGVLVFALSPAVA